MNKEENPQQSVNIQLNPEAVILPLVRAVKTNTDIVGFGLSSLDSFDFSKMVMSGEASFIKFKISSPTIELPPEKKKEEYRNWLLARGFHECIKGVRTTLEEAFLYINLVNLPPDPTTLEVFRETTERLKNSANGLNFPRLLGEVNRGLLETVGFETEFASLNKVRNCLEHRNGIVGDIDIAEDGLLTLRIPRLKFFYEKDDKEIEVEKDVPIENAAIKLRLESREKKYERGDLITFSTQEFKEISMACLFFGNDLIPKLPRRES